MTNLSLKIHFYNCVMGEKNVVWKGDFEIDLVKQDSLTSMRHHANQQIKKLQDHADL